MRVSRKRPWTYSRSLRGILRCQIIVFKSPSATFQMSMDIIEAHPQGPAPRFQRFPTVFKKAKLPISLSCPALWTRVVTEPPLWEGGEF